MNVDETIHIKLNFTKLIIILKKSGLIYIYILLSFFEEKNNIVKSKERNKSF